MFVTVKSSKPYNYVALCSGYPTSKYHMSASFVTETKDKEQGIKMSLSGMIFKLT
jgi:hypothetical protein